MNMPVLLIYFQVKLLLGSAKQEAMIDFHLSLTPTSFEFIVRSNIIGEGSTYD